MMWHLYEKREVTIRRDGCVYATTPLYTQWFQYNQCPKEFQYDKNDEFWCYKGETKFQPEKPE